MKKIILLLVVFCCIEACSEKEEKNLAVTGKIQGLKKGTLYLQKIEDTSLVNIDSVLIDGEPSFAFETNLESPQVLYLYLDKVDGTELDDRILFFAEPGKMTINTTLDNFEDNAVVEGSENQKKLIEYRQMMDRFKSEDLDLIKANLEARQQQDQQLIDSTNSARENLIKRRYLYTVNFALNNKNLELAPYLAISEVYDANIKYLDTIYSSLTPKVRQSEYGETLQDFLEERHRLEEKDTEVEANLNSAE